MRLRVSFTRNNLNGTKFRRLSVRKFERENRGQSFSRYVSLRGRRSKEKGKGIWALDRAQGRREEGHAWPQFFKQWIALSRG